MTKSDQELRDELASEESAAGYEWATNRKMPLSDIAYEWGVKAGFKAGWDAARANDKERDQLRAEVSQLKETLEIYKAEASRHADTAVNAFGTVKQLQDELAAEKNYSAETAARLELALKEYAEYVRGKPGEWYVTQLQAENDQLRAQCEKLAEAVEQQQKKGHNDTCSQILIGEGPCDCGKTLGGFALAEYREMNQTKEKWK